MKMLDQLWVHLGLTRVQVASAALATVMAIGCSPTNTGAAAAAGASGANALAGTSGAGGAASLMSAGGGPSVGGAAADAGSASPSDAGSCQPVAPATQPQPFPGEVAQVTATCGVNGNAPPLLAPLPPSTLLSIDVDLVSDDQALADYAMAVSDPTSPLYRHYLTSAQITEMFGPSECTYQALIDWATAYGLTPTPFSDRFLLGVSGTAAQINAALHVKLQSYQRPDGSTFYAPDRDPSIDFSIPLLAVSGLDNCFVSKPVLSTYDAGSAGAGG